MILETQTSSRKVHALIVAAGKGSRFGADIPKQYINIADKTVLQHTVDKLAQSQYINACYVVIDKDDDYAKALGWAMPIHYAVGGAERWQSVLAGVEMIAKTAQPDDLMVIHDAARPCVLPSDIDTVIEVASQEEYGAILAIPVADTLKHVGDNDAIIKTINRDCLWHAQTPQVFRLKHLQTVLKVVKETGLLITDEASGFEQLDYIVKVVTGSRTNIKLTYKEDLALLQFILSNQ